MQFALGGGYVYIKDEYTGPFIGAERVKGGGTLFSAAFGGGVGGGFVIAGGFESFTGTVDHTDTWTNDGGGFTEQEVDVGGVTGFGMLQKYIGPLYLRALVGGMVGGPDGDEADSYGGLMLGTAVGVDFSVSRRWALGGSFGFRYASGSYSDDDGYSGDFSMTLTSLQFAATFF